MSILDRFRLDGQRLFITGGSRGLGREMALAIADAGADVVLAGRDAESLGKTADDIRALLRRALADKDRGLGAHDVRMHDEALDFLAKVCDGDARQGALGPAPKKHLQLLRPQS